LKAFSAKYQEWRHSNNSNPQGRLLSRLHK
jgi:hypothetical protein